MNDWFTILRLLIGIIGVIIGGIIAFWKLKQNIKLQSIEKEKQKLIESFAELDSNLSLLKRNSLKYKFSESGDEKQDLANLGMKLRINAHKSYINIYFIAKSNPHELIELTKKVHAV